ncbi:MAG: glycosyl hydrolase family 8 [Hyphomicrobiales bacterium]|nr:glycosyl hydrolase family 8 [Hyphomicrobiales bacterium]
MTVRRFGPLLRLGLAAIFVATLGVGLLGLPEGEPTDAVAAPSGVVAPLAGRLTVPGLWTAYAARFVTPEGRVVDDVNGGVSHSESQGYGMLLALAADDRDAFRRIWTWTRANLFLRPDGLASWRWQPGPAPNVRDPNNASDGDVLIAWALLQAGDAWSDPAFAAAGRRLARAVWDRNVVKTAWGPTLLPAVAGFRAGDRRDGPVINPSYWIFPAFADFDRLVPDRDWSGLAAAGAKILASGRGATGLPAEWLSLAGHDPVPADGFPAVFGYNAVRVPLYLAWTAGVKREALAPFMTRWSKEGADAPAMAVVDLAGGRDLESFADPGYRAVAALVACALEGTRIPDALRTADVDHYYPATLRALALIAVEMRHPTCW